MFVIYHTTYKHRFTAPSGYSSWDKERVAKALFTKMVNQGKLSREDWKVASYEEWVADDHMITVKNVLSGKEVQIRASDKGGSSDPSTELFHCM